MGRNGRTGGGVWMHLMGNSMTVFGLGSRKVLVSTISGLKNEPSYIVGPPFPVFNAHFSATYMPG